jgi:hypothetical protein
VAAALALGALLVARLAACGGGDSSESTTTATERAQASTGGRTAQNRPAPAPAGEGSASFRTPGGDNSIQNYGEEADASEVEEATAALAGYLRARAKGDWESSCAYLAKDTLAPLEELAARSSQLKGKRCGEILAALEGQVPASARANTLTGRVASLRVQGERAFALYHGAGGVDYFVPMTREDGAWKLGAVAPSEFPQTP